MIIRPLGDTEYTYWMMGLASCTNFVVQCRLRGELPTRVISEALRVVQACHPLLRATIAPDRTAGAVFVSCGATLPLIERDLDAPSTASISSDTPLIQCIEAAQRTDMCRDPLPLLRCELLRHGGDDQTLLLTFHHAVADGASAMALIHRIVDTADCLLQGEHPRPSPCPDLGPLEGHIPPHFCGTRAAGRFWWHGLKLNLARWFLRPVHVPVDQRAWPDQRRERFVMSTMDRARTRLIVQGSRRHGCSVHAALTAAQLLALAKEYPLKKVLRVFLLSLVDLRRRLPEVADQESLNTMISMAEICCRFSRDADLWSLAQETQTLLHRRLDGGFHFYYFPWLTRTLRRSHRLRRGDENGSRRMLRQGQLARPPVWPVSNLGNLAMARFGRLRIDDLSFVLPLSASGLFGSAINTFDGRLYWNFSYASPAVSAERGLCLARNSIDILSEAVADIG